MKEAQENGDVKELANAQAMQQEVMSKQNAMMLNSFKPLLVTIVPIMLIFWWMTQPSNPINHINVELPQFVYYILLIPLWHIIYEMMYGGGSASPFILGWLGWYLLCTLAMSQIFRKFMGF